MEGGERVSGGREGGRERKGRGKGKMVDRTRKWKPIKIGSKGGSEGGNRGENTQSIHVYVGGGGKVVDRREQASKGR